LGISGEEARVSGFTELPDTGAFGYDVRHGKGGSLELVSPTEYTSIGRIAGDYYIPMSRAD